MFTNIGCIKKAILGLNLDFSHIAGHPDAIFVPSLKENFINSATPFNTQSTSRLLRDKYLTHSLLDDVIKQPKTKSFFDPSRIEWQSFIKEKSINEIVKSVKKDFSFPVIIKKNNGERGNNVFVSKNEVEVAEALKNVFKNDKNYDYVALAQEYIRPKNEYTAMFVLGDLEFVYEKPIVEANGQALSNHKRGRALLVQDKKFIKKIKDFCAPIFPKIGADWCSLDVVEDENSDLWLIEINSSPNFSYFVESNGEEKVLAIYNKMISRFLKHVTS